MDRKPGAVPAATLPPLTVLSAAAWATWLGANAAASRGVWLTLAKKNSIGAAPTSLTYAEALDEALCHGWIDGQTRSIDVHTYAHRFQPRTSTSTWSKRNVGIVARLQTEGRILPAGLAAVDAAKADGRWERAYAGAAEATPPPEFFAALEAVPAATKMYEAIARFVEMLARGETVHPQKRRPADDTHVESDTAPAAKRPKKQEQKEGQQKEGDEKTGEQAPDRRLRQGLRPRKAKGSPRPSPYR
ncbi:hypothetical protein ABW21_db0208567 [Orbilia brochopaga]|nr:hypothetical protein ABW21_db0208567 [Drechslerella brochopaga]